MAQETEQEILNYLRHQPKEVTFYKLYTDLNYTSGKAQSALRRMQKNGTVYLRKKISKFKTYVFHKPFELEPKIIKNKDEKIMIFPFSLNYTVGTILKQVPEVSDEYPSFMELVSKAVEYFFQEKLPYELRRKAVYLAVEKGKISEKLGKYILGE